MSNATPHVVFRDADADLLAALDAAQRAILRHPVAAQAAFASLVAEGRRFAATPEGEAWRARLQGTVAVERSRMVWEAASLGALRSEANEVLPGALIEALARIAARGDLERFLGGWFERRLSGSEGMP